MLPSQTFNVRMRKGENSPRFATLRHNDINRTLVMAADVDTIKLRVIAGIGEGPSVVIEDFDIAPAPGPLTIPQVIFDTPLTGPGYVGDPAGANFSYVLDWDSLSNDKYDGLRVYREEYEIDCRVNGVGAVGASASRLLLVYNVTIASTMGPITA